MLSAFWLQISTAGSLSSVTSIPPTNKPESSRPPWGHLAEITDFDLLPDDNEGQPVIRSYRAVAYFRLSCLCILRLRTCST